MPPFVLAEVRVRPARLTRENSGRSGSSWAVIGRRPSSRSPALRVALACWLSVFFFGAHLIVSAQQAGGLRAPEGTAGEVVGNLPEKLAGKDDPVGALAANELIRVISNTDTSEELRRKVYLDFLLERLDASGLGSNIADLVSAERIVTALGTWIDANGSPFVGGRVVLLPLVGLGTVEFRVAVIRALRVLAAAEGGTVEGSPTLRELRDRLLHEEPPPKAVIEDVSAILWATDAKALFGTLVEALEKRVAAEDPQSRQVTQAILRELRSRLRLNFATVGAWKDWWTAVAELPLETIFAQSVEVTQHRYVANWKNILRRFKETGDGRGVLLSIQETLDGSPDVELRLAAVTALGDYARWVRDTKLADSAGAGAADVAQAKERLLSEAVGTLVSLQTSALERRRGATLESLRVLKAGLSSLRPYQTFLESHPALAREVASLVVAALKQVPLKVAFVSQRDYLLEGLRLAGVLQVDSVRPLIEEIVRPENAPWSQDLEVLTTAVSTLGVLLDENSSRAWITRLIALFEVPREADPNELREFRRVCVNALNGAAETGIKDPEARTALRGFFQQLLEDVGERRNSASPPSWAWERSRERTTRRRSVYSLASCLGPRSSSPPSWWRPSTRSRSSTRRSPSPSFCRAWLNGIKWSTIICGNAWWLWSEPAALTSSLKLFVNCSRCRFREILRSSSRRPCVSRNSRGSARFWRRRRWTQVTLSSSRRRGRLRWNSLRSTICLVQKRSGTSF
jgi:hypothetical protein